MAKDPMLGAKEAAQYIGVSISSLHKLCRPVIGFDGKVKLEERVRNRFIGRDRYFLQSDLDTYLANEDAQKRRRKSWRQDPEHTNDPKAARNGHVAAKTADQRGPLPNGNLPADAGTLARLEIAPGSKATINGQVVENTGESVLIICIMCFSDTSIVLSFPLAST